MNFDYVYEDEDDEFYGYEPEADYIAETFGFVGWEDPNAYVWGW